MKNDLKEIRQYLHKHPELSGNEHNTAKYIIGKLEQSNADNIIKVQTCNGVIAIFKSNIKHPTICFRADFDALPINEINELPYASINPNVSHKCGHDGHTTILLGLAEWINLNRKKINCNIILLFQPEEETGEGALKIVNDLTINNLNPDYLFGFHNIPGYPLGSIVIKPDIFSLASRGLKIKITGKTSHASEPDKADNPLLKLLEIVEYLNRISKSVITNQFCLTITHLRLGENSFGITPGEANIFAALRANSDMFLDSLGTKIEKKIQTLMADSSLKININWIEKFPAIRNDNDLYSLILQVAEKNSHDLIIENAPFKWSEDFAYYKQVTRTCFWGFGAGINHPELHNPNYDFPDSLLNEAILFCQNLIKELSHN